METLMDLENDFLICIEAEIEKKYNITNPIFFYNFKEFKYREKLINWCDYVTSQDSVIKYKRIKDNQFELKDFYHYPTDEVCKKIINESTSWIHKKHKESTVFFKIGHGLYNEKELPKRLLIALREGFSSISIGDLIKDLKPNSNRIIYEVSFSQNSELEVDIMNGFVELENKY